MKKIIKIVCSFIAGILAFMSFNFKPLEVKAEDKGYLSATGFKLEFFSNVFDFTQRSKNTYTCSFNSNYSDNRILILDSKGNELQRCWISEIYYNYQFENPNVQVILHVVDDNNFNVYAFDNVAPEEDEDFTIFKSDGVVDGGYYAQLADVEYDWDLEKLVEVNTKYIVLPDSRNTIKSVNNGAGKEYSPYSEIYYETDGEAFVEFEKQKSDITISSYSVDEKAYDGTTDGVCNYTADGIFDGDNVTITAKATFADASVGNGKEVKVSFEITGDDAGYYNAIADKSTVADIVPAILTVSNLVVEDKDYDGTTEAKCSYDVEGKIEGDDVKVTATAEFADAKAGNSKEVNVSFEITGEAAANYTIFDQTSSANISPATPSYEIPTLEATEGDTLADIKLPEGFSFEDALTTSVGKAGSNTFNLTYTPSDTDNYATVIGIRCTITVKEASKPDTSEDKSDEPSISASDPIDDEPKDTKEKSNGWIAIPISLVALLGVYGTGFYFFSKGKLTGKVFNTLYSWLKKIFTKK